MVSVPIPNNGDASKQASKSYQKASSAKEPSFEALPDSIPPQNLEAEEAILGGILLDPDAISRVADVLRSDSL